MPQFKFIGKDDNTVVTTEFDAATIPEILKQLEGFLMFMTFELAHNESIQIVEGESGGN